MFSLFCQEIYGTVYDITYNVFTILSGIYIVACNVFPILSGNILPVYCKKPQCLLFTIRNFYD
jgi:hypothetical protein